MNRPIATIAPTEDIPDAVPADSQVLPLWQAWTAAYDRRGGRLPARADLTPTDLLPCLGNLIILDVVDGGANFRYRLYGTKVCLGHGGDMTGKYVTDLPAAVVPAMLAFYRRILAERRPLFSRQEAARTVPVWLWDRLTVPLAADGARVDMLMSAMHPVRFRREPERNLYVASTLR